MTPGLVSKGSELVCSRLFEMILQQTYELHLGDEKKSSTPLSMNARALHHTYDRGSLLFNNIFVDLC